MEQLNKITPIDVHRFTTTKKIPARAMEFLHTYTINKATTSQNIMVSNNNPRDNTEALTIMTHNIGGRLADKLKVDSHFMMVVLTEQPHIIIIQEHLMSNAKKQEFEKRMQIAGYTLLNHSKALKTEIQGRGSGGMAMWVDTRLLEHYSHTNKSSTAHKQHVRLTYKPKNNQSKPFPNIHLTNVYCRPTWTDQYFQEYLEQIAQDHKDPEALHIILGDFNSRHKVTGDTTTNKWGKKLQQFCKQKNLITMNTELAHGVPTNININGGTSIIDLLLVPQHQQHLWNNITTQEAHWQGESIHHKLIARTNIPINIVTPPSKYKYIINYTHADKQRLKRYLKTHTQAAQETIIKQLDDVLPKYNTQQKQKLIEATQDAIIALHHITGIIIFGIKKVSTQPPRINRFKTDDRIMNIIEDPDLHPAEKIQYLKPIVQEIQTQHRYRMKYEQLSESVVDMFKKYSKNKQKYKTPYPEHIKTTGGVLMPVEQGYANYLENDLMTPITEPPPEIDTTLTQHKDKTPEKSPISIEAIDDVIKEMHKDKAPGITTIPINYYHWGGRTTREMLYQWYKTMEKNNYVPWNLKIDIKTPFPKFEKGAPIIDQRNPTKYRPIALQNSMYKILDGCIKQDLEIHNELHDIIKPNQGGFKQKEGTIEHLFVLQNIFHYNQTVFCAFLDLQKAYDSVWREALFQKLEKQYNVNEGTIKMIKAMYKDTRSITRINDTISPIFKTHNGLQQGALSSPILFNFYINDLIINLNKHTIGTKIGQHKINNLLFADDICLTTTNKEDLQILLDECTRWAKKWKLQFSPDKSKTLTTETEEIGYMLLQGSKIKETDTQNYKYLGIPITKQGINVTKYLEHIKKKFQAATREMITYCNNKQINYHNKIILYKTVVRAQLDYGINIIYYDENEIKDLENEQYQALKRLLKIHRKVNKDTLLAIHQIPTIKQRIHTMKIGFYLKLKQPKNNSMSYIIYKQITNRQPMRPKHLKRKPPLTEIEQILQHQELIGLKTLSTTIPYKEIEKIIKQELKHKYNKKIRTKQENQCKHQMNIYQLGHCPVGKIEGKAIADCLDKYNHIPMKYNDTYIPLTPIEPKLQMINYMIEGDNNPEWYRPRRCENCGIKYPYPRLHQLLNCRSNTTQRAHIFESVVKELIILEQKYHKHTNKNPIIPAHYRSVMLDIANEGKVPQSQIAAIYSVMTGGKTNHKIPQHITNETNRMLTAHLLLLIQTAKKNIPTTNDNFTEVKEMHIYTDDLEKGKIVARTKAHIGAPIRYRNIRDTIDSLSIPQLIQYNVGMGSATSRTKNQKIVADMYTKRIIQAAYDFIIFTDGSIDTKNDKRPKEIQKASKEGHGGYGGVMINKQTDQIHKQYCDKINTNDPQLTELHAINTALKILPKLPQEIHNNQISILSDCKNAVNYIRGDYQTPYKYKDIYQEIQERLAELTIEIKIHIDWIPGHTNNKWNDKADELAKAATQLWLALPDRWSHHNPLWRLLRHSLSAD